MSDRAHVSNEKQADAPPGFGPAARRVPESRTEHADGERDGGTRREQACEAGMRQIPRALHDLAQPLSALQGRLELGRAIGTEEACREAVLKGLEDFDRVRHELGAIRQLVRESLLDGDGEEMLRGHA